MNGNYYGNECVIDEINVAEEIGDIAENFTGLVKRDLDRQPVGSVQGSEDFSPAVHLLSWEEINDRIRDMQAAKARVSDLRNFEALNQNGEGFCWAYDAVQVVMLLRAIQGLPPIRLSPHALACRIMNHRDKGAWAALAVEKLIEWGCPSEGFWPQQSMSRRYDTPEAWEDAQKYRITEAFFDMDAQHPADAHLEGRFQAVLSLLASGNPVTGDFYHMGHSVALMDAVIFEEVSDLTDVNRYGVRFLNSYGPDWKGNGTAVLRGKLAVPDGATAPRAVVVS